MKKYLKSILLSLVFILVLLMGCAGPTESYEDEGLSDLPIVEVTQSVEEDGEYTSKEEVAEYIYLYGHLPGNYITKKEAKALGWDNKEGNLGKVAPGKSIGGDYFGNFEGLLPEADDRDYRYC